MYELGDKLLTVLRGNPTCAEAAKAVGMDVEAVRELQAIYMEFWQKLIKIQEKR